MLSKISKALSRTGVAIFSSLLNYSFPLYSEKGKESKSKLSQPQAEGWEIQRRGWRGRGERGVFLGK